MELRKIFRKMCTFCVERGKKKDVKEVKRIITEYKGTLFLTQFAVLLLYKRSSDFFDFIPYFIRRK